MLVRFTGIASAQKRPCAGERGGRDAIDRLAMLTEDGLEWPSSGLILDSGVGWAGMPSSGSGDRNEPGRPGSRNPGAERPYAEQLGPRIVAEEAEVKPCLGSTESHIRWPIFDSSSP